MNNCLTCKEIKYPLCGKCAKEPFLVERARQILAGIGDFDTLGKIYNLKYAEIEDLNTLSFWNRRLSDKASLKDQDGMVKDRIRTAFKFLPRKARKVFDIGAGYGFIEELLSKNKNIQIFGNDISSVSVKKLKARFGLQFRKESIYKMKYSRLFDAVFLLEVLEHIPPHKTFEILKKIKTMLRENGLFILSIPTNEGLEKMKGNPNGHTRTYTENLIRAELKIAGFRIIKIRTLYAFRNFYSFKKILSKFLRNRWKPNDIVILSKKL